MGDLIRGATPVPVSDTCAQGLLQRLHLAPSTLNNQYTVTYAEEAPLEGAGMRCRNISKYYQRRAGAKVLLVSQAPGHVGARWSGIPLTDTETIASGRLGEDYEFSLVRTEPSSQAVHEGLGRHWGDVLLWSVVPWHPAGRCLDSNRKPSQIEVCAGIEVLEYVLAHGEFRAIAALGEVASGALERLRVRHRVLPHPFYAGRSACIKGVRAFVGDVFGSTAPS